MAEKKPKSKAEELQDLRRQYPKAQMDWTAEEDRELIELRDSSIEELSRRFERQPGAIESRLKKLTKRGLIPKEKPVEPVEVSAVPAEPAAPPREGALARGVEGEIAPTPAMAAGTESGVGGATPLSGTTAARTHSPDETAPPTMRPVTAPVHTEPSRPGLWILVAIVLLVIAISIAFLIRWYADRVERPNEPARQTTMMVEHARMAFDIELRG